MIIQHDILHPSCTWITMSGSILHNILVQHRLSEIHDVISDSHM